VRGIEVARASFSSDVRRLAPVLVPLLVACQAPQVTRDEVAPQAAAVPEPAASSAPDASGAPRDAGPRGVVDTHEHFAHTRAPVPGKLPYFRRRGAAQEIVLTFDCAWVPEDRGLAVLDALREANVSATFFVAGPFVVGPKGGVNTATTRLVRRIVEGGHEVGNHTRTHPHAAPAVDYGAELASLDAAWRLAVGVAFPEGPPRSASMLPLWRAPYGEYDPRALAAAAAVGFPTHVGWNVDLQDSIGLPACPAATECLSAERETQKVLRFVRASPEADVIVVLAHLGAPYGFGSDPKGIRELVRTLRAEGRAFAKVSEVLAP
jgi:peptidoglycan/xylan/chitin deacetylase (PgdA/CDA1 family)